MNRILMLGLLMMAWWSPGADVFAQVSERPQISVTGTAVTCVNPDEIIWSITTTDEDPDLTKAKIQVINRRHAFWPFVIALRLRQSN